MPQSPSPLPRKRKLPAVWIFVVAAAVASFVAIGVIVVILGFSTDSPTQKRIKNHLLHEPTAIKDVLDVKASGSGGKDFLDGKPAQEWYALVELKPPTPFSDSRQTMLVLYVSDTTILAGPPFAANRITHGR